MRRCERIRAALDGRYGDRSVGGVRSLRILSLLSLASASLVALTIALASGCSSKAALVGSGGQCQLATDCNEGLYCYKGVCIGDAGAAQVLAPTPDAGTGAAPTNADGAGPAQTPTPDASAGD